MTKLHIVGLRIDDKDYAEQKKSNIISTPQVIKPLF